MSGTDAIAISALINDAIDTRQQLHMDGFARIAVDEKQWTALAHGCASGLQDLLSLWFDDDTMHLALRCRDTSLRAIAALPVSGGHYPAIGQAHAPAIRLERAMMDLYGVTAQGLVDTRPWLDHGVWPTAPHANPARAAKHRDEPYRFLAVEGEGLHQIPVGPVHAGIIEPGHFRFTANGEAVVRLEQRLGYTHKGVEALCVGLPIEQAARVIARMSGDSTVAYGFAFARAIESIADIEVPARAQLLRGVMAELERIAHHINDIGAICNDTSAVALQAHCSLIREQVLAMSARCFGHRMMMDVVIPGGVAADPDDAAIEDLRLVLDECEGGLKIALRTYDESASIQDRTVSTGIVSEELVRRFAAGGYVGRASGRDADARRDPGYAPYGQVEFEVIVRSAGDVDARLWVRADEMQQSIAIIRQLLDQLQPGPVRSALPVMPAAQAAAQAEAFRGDVFITVRTGADDRIAHCHARDASWFQWPLLEAAIEGNIVADFPLCNKSFNCSYSGHDL